MTVSLRSAVPRRASRERAARDDRAHLLDVLLIAGLAGVFVVNALAALLQPGDFTELVEHSLVGRSVPAMSGRWVAWAIAVHDLTIGSALVATMWLTRPRRFVLAWAGTWLLAVTLVKLTALQALGG